MSLCKNITFCELKEKEVINVVDGKRLGRIIDLVFTCTGCIVGLVVPGSKKMFKCFTSSENIFVPWCNICKIGDDVILVELLECNCLGDSCEICNEESE